MTARDDLAADITAAVGRFDPIIANTPSPRIVELLAEDLAERWCRRPRVVTTAAELDALPVRTRILHEGSGVIYYRVQYRNPHTPSWEWRVLQPGRGLYLLSSEMADLPYVVIWSPPVESGETQGGAS